MVHLHCHSDFSLLDGIAKVEKLVTKAKELKLSALALTDHRTLSGLYSFHKQCRENGIKPILGVEVDVVEDRTKREKQKSQHLVLLAKNFSGYQELLKIVNDANENGYYYVPKTDLSFLARCNRDNLIATTACIGGVISSNLANDNYESALAQAKELKFLFGNQLYLEIQPHIHPIQNKVNLGLLKISRRLDISLVATNDVHYLDEEDAELYDYVKLIRFNKTADDLSNFRASFRSLFLKSSLEMEAGFKQQNIVGQRTVEKAIASTDEIANLVESYDFDRGLKFQGFYENGATLLRQKTITELRRRGLNNIPVYKDRLVEELNLINKKNFSEYFLVYSEITEHCKDNNLIMGLGRGSSSGSLVAYLLQITKLDPIKFNLSFSRFMSESRKELPDIDSDFGVEDRKEVKLFLQKRFGVDRVIDIGTFSSFQLKALVKDFVRVFNIQDKQLMSELSQIEDFDIANLDKFTYLKEKYPDLFAYSKKLLGNKRHISRHASGIILSQVPVGSHIPIIRCSSGLVTGYIEATARAIIAELSSLGFVKFDILGLKNLSIIKECLAYQGKRLEDINIDSIIMDQKVFKEFAAGNTLGTFQFEGDNMRDILKQLNVDDIEDLIAACALYRPGPIEAGMIEDFIKRKNSGFKAETPVDKILASTYGLIVYQEQIMRLAQELAGFSPSEADELRKMISKYKTTDNFALQGFKDIVIKSKERFISGSKNVIGQEEAEDLWDKMAEFAKYSFNRSHSAAYAITGFLTMYLKVYFPLEYMCSLLNHSDDDLKQHKYLIETERLGIKLLDVDMNKSMKAYSIDKERYGIVAGLTSLKGVGDKVADKIIANRPFADLEELKKKVGNTAFKAFSNKFSADNVSSLAEIYQSVDNCELCKTSCNKKGGCSGNPLAKVLVIGLAPKLSGGKFNAPFGLDTRMGWVGSGKFLVRGLKKLGLKFPDDFYITNIVKCPVYPVSEENIKHCKDFVMAEIRFIKPKVVICLGSPAAKLFGIRIGGETKIQDTKVIANYHPAYISRDPSKEDDFMDIFKKYKEYFNFKEEQ